MRPPPPPLPPRDRTPATSLKTWQGGWQWGRGIQGAERRVIGVPVTEWPPPPFPTLPGDQSGGMAAGANQQLRIHSASIHSPGSPAGANQQPQHQHRLAQLPRDPIRIHSKSIQGTKPLCVTKCSFQSYLTKSLRLRRWNPE